jgi:hypothetical protein
MLPVSKRSVCTVRAGEDTILCLTQGKGIVVRKSWYLLRVGGEWGSQVASQLKYDFLDVTELTLILGICALGRHISSCCLCMHLLFFFLTPDWCPMDYLVEGFILAQNKIKYGTNAS